MSDEETQTLQPFQTTPIMDFPTAWAFVRTTEPAQHHLDCSWRRQNGAFLCDCDVLNAEYMRRKALRRV